METELNGIMDSGETLPWMDVMQVLMIQSPLGFSLQLGDL